MLVFYICSSGKMSVLSCAITRPVSAGEEKINREWTEKVLCDFTQVSVKSNALLKAIVEARSRWLTSPIVWVGNFPYKIKVLEQTQTRAVLLQMCVDFYHKKNGKQAYSIVNKRKVEIVFHTGFPVVGSSKANL